MLFIVGPSGRGEATLLSMISGILRPTSGSEIWTQNSDHLADFRLHTIGFVFQDYHLFPRLTAENVAIPLLLQDRDWNQSIAEENKYLEIVGLKGRGEILPLTFSGGEQQRVAIAQAIVASLVFSWEWRFQVRRFTRLFPKTSINLVRSKPSAQELTNSFT